MQTYRIEYERKGCIGAAVCELVDPDHFSLAADGLADLIGGTLVNEEKGMYVLEVEADKDQLDKICMAAQGCPANVIRVYEKETGEQVA